jgi:F-type H+-transporting ATPase subunit b
LDFSGKVDQKVICWNLGIYVMNINATLLGQAITFAIFVWFTMKFVWPPLMKAITDRQKKIADGLANAEQANAELVRAKKTVHEELSAARKRAAEIVEHANKRAEQLVIEAQQQAVQAKQQVLAQAQVEIIQKQQEAREQLQTEIVKIAMLGVEKVLTQNIDKKTQQALLEQWSAGIK